MRRDDLTDLLIIVIGTALFATAVMALVYLSETSSCG